MTRTATKSFPPILILSLPLVPLAAFRVEQSLSTTSPLAGLAVHKENNLGPGSNVCRLLVRCLISFRLCLSLSPVH